MSFEEIAVRMRFILQDTDLKRLQQGLRNSRIETQKFNTAATVLNKQLPKGFKTTGKELEGINKRMKQFKFEWLSVMFFGMALQRAFGGILRAGFQTFNKVTEGTEKAGGAITQLTAAWEFFKFSLIDALTQSELFQGLVDFALRMVELWSDLPGRVKEFVGEVILAGAAIGTALFAAGTINLGLQGVGLVTDQANSLRNTLKNTIGAFTIAWSLAQAADAYKDFKEGKFVNGLLGALSSAFGAIGGIRLLKSKKGGATLLAIGVGMELLKQDAFFQTVLGTLGAVVSAVTAALAALVYSKLPSMVADFVSKIQTMLRAFAASIQKYFPDFASKIDDFADALEKVKPEVKSMGEVMSEAFVQTYADWSEAGKKLDADLSNLKTKADQQIALEQYQDDVRAGGTLPAPILTDADREIIRQQLLDINKERNIYVNVDVEPSLNESARAGSAYLS
jgi:hypothetical protein